MERYREVIEQFLKDFDACEMCLIGIGAEWKAATGEDYDSIAAFLGNKNYFVVTSLDARYIRTSKMNQKRVTAPYIDGEEGQSQWEFYNQWLSTTLNHKLLLLELGEGFLNPNLIRWPFENVAYINQKAKLYRVHETLSNTEARMKDRAVAVRANSLTFMRNVFGNTRL